MSRQAIKDVSESKASKYNSDAQLTNVIGLEPLRCKLFLQQLNVLRGRSDKTHGLGGIELLEP